MLPSGAGSDTLGYALYQDSGRTQVWSTGGQARGENYQAALFGSYKRTPVYGRMPAGQYVPAETYSEAPAVTIIY